MTTLPYVYDYPVMSDYLKAVKPVRAAWNWMMRNAEWKSPAEQWRWCWEQPEAEQCR